MNQADKILNRLGFQAVFSFNNALEAVEFAKKSVFSCVELNMISPVFLPERYNKREKMALRQSGIPILIHAPTDLSLYITHKSVLDAIIKRLFEVIDFGFEIGAKRITMHLGSTFSISYNGEMPMIHKFFPEEYKDCLKYSLVRLSNYAKGKIPLCVENTSGFRYGFVHPVLSEFLSHNLLSLTWDIGHTNILKGTNKKEEEDFFIRFLDRIKNCHIHDNNGEWDEHNIIGKGNIDFKKYFSILNNTNSYFILEVRPKERAIKSYKRLKFLLSS